MACHLTNEKDLACWFDIVKKQKQIKTGNKSELSHHPVGIIVCHIQYSKDSWKRSSTIQRTSWLVYTYSLYSCALLHNCLSPLSKILNIYVKKEKKKHKKDFCTSLPYLCSLWESVRLLHHVIGYGEVNHLWGTCRSFWVRLLLNEPFFLWFVDGFWVVGADDGRVCRLTRRLAAAFGFVGVVGAFVAEHVANEEHQRTQDGEDHHRDDACRDRIHTVTESPRKQNGKKSFTLCKYNDIVIALSQNRFYFTSNDGRVSVDPIRNDPFLI